MSRDETWDRVVVKMIEDTRRDVIQWSHAAGHIDLLGSVVGAVYIARIAEKIVRVYEYQYTDYDPHSDEERSQRDAVIEIASNRGELEFRFPETLSRYSLLNAVREQVSGATDFASRYLQAS